MKIRTLRSIYYPLTIPRPERLRRWVRKVPYSRAEIVGGGEVSAVRYQLPAATPEIAGKRIAFASDFHYGGSAHDRLLAEQAAEHIRAFRPDVLCLGGDLAADAIELTKLPELLEILRNCAPLRLAILGNWEHGKNWLMPTYWEKLFASSGIRLLRNAGAEYRGFFFYGSDELTGGSPHLPERWPDGRYPVLLAHRPDTAIALDSLRALDPVGLILCGHTHGGQLRFPLIGALYAASNYGCKLDYGLFERRGAETRMIVSSGVGNRSLGFRFRCRREVVLIEFV